MLPETDTLLLFHAMGELSGLGKVTSRNARTKSGAVAPARLHQKRRERAGEGGGLATFSWDESLNRSAGLRAGAFTLIEMLVVIAVIGILAGIILTVAPAVADRRSRSTVETKLKQVANAIDAYKLKQGYYPPSSRGTPYNSLLYELTGGTSDGATYTNTLTEDILTTQQITTYFGVGGILNAVPVGRSESYLTGLRDSDYGPIPPPVGLAPSPQLPRGGPQVLLVPARATNDSLPNVWYYDASSPDRRNKNSYDLWAEVKLGNKVIRIANWRE